MCENKVTVYIPKGYGYKEVKMKCGNTGPNGELLMCDVCETRNKKQYPQGWKHVPGDICKHGVYVGNAHGADHMCGGCEDGE